MAIKERSEGFGNTVSEADYSPLFLVGALGVLFLVGMCSKNTQLKIAECLNGKARDSKVSVVELLNDTDLAQFAVGECVYSEGCLSTHLFEAIFSSGIGEEIRECLVGKGTESDCEGFLECLPDERCVDRNDIEILMGKHGRNFILPEGVHQRVRECLVGRGGDR